MYIKRSRQSNTCIVKKYTAYSQFFCVAQWRQRRSREGKRVFTPARWRAALPVNESSIVPFTLEASLWCEAHAGSRLCLIPWLLELMSDWTCWTLALYSSRCRLDLLSHSVYVSGTGTADRGQRQLMSFHDVIECKCLAAMCLQARDIVCQNWRSRPADGDWLTTNLFRGSRRVRMLKVNEWDCSCTEVQPTSNHRKSLRER